MIRLYTVHGYLAKPTGPALPLHKLVVAADDDDARAHALDLWQRLFGREATIRAREAVAVECVGGYGVRVEVAG